MFTIFWRYLDHSDAVSIGIILIIITLINNTQNINIYKKKF